MKLGTIVKVGALAVAAGSTAIGTVMLTTKALAKVEKKPAEAPIDTSNGPVINRPFGEEASQYVAPVVETPAPVVEETPAFVEPEPTTTFVAPEPEPAPVFATPEPTPMPVFTEPEPEPVSFATVEVEPVVEPVAVDLPTIEAPAVEEPVLVASETEYADIGYQLPYMAGNLDASDDRIVVGGAVKEEAPAPVVEEPAPVVEEPTPVVEEPAPVVEEPAPVVEEPTPVVEEAPAISGLGLINAALAETSVEAPVEAPAEPEIVISNAEPIAVDETPAEIDAPLDESVNPLASGFRVDMTDAAEPHTELLPREEATEPVTFDSIQADDAYIEEIPSMSEPEEVEPVVEAAPVDDKGNETKIGDTIVSDKPSNPNIAAVTAKFGIPSDNLVSIEAAGNMPMVFEFLYSDMRNDASLVSVYFMMNGEATLPPETDRENVLAFGRNFITGNDDLKAFLA